MVDGNVFLNNPGCMTKVAAMPIYGNQRTNGPVSAHLRSAKMIFEGFFAIMIWRPSWSCDLDYL